MTPGVTVSCTVSAMHRRLALFCFLPSMAAPSLSRMKRNARTIDGDAPVISVKNPAPEMITADLVFLTEGELPNIASIRERSIYMIPRCIPDNARRCDAPLSLNIFLVLPSSPLRSPVRNAQTSAPCSFSEYPMSMILRLRASRHP